MLRRSWIILLLLAALLVASSFGARMPIDTGATLNTPPNLPPPKFPASYSTTYIFSLPYTAQVQRDMVNYTVSFFRDAEGKSPRVRIDTLGGVNSIIAFSDREFEITPRLDVQVCRVNDPDPDEGDTADMTVLPDISEWKYNGNEYINGKDTSLYVYQQHHENKNVEYKFYVDQTGSPVRLHMVGNDIFTGAHYDEWIAEYVDFKAGSPEESVFDIPELCQQQSKSHNKHHSTPSSSSFSSSSSISSTLSFRMRLLAPTVRYGGEDPEYDAFLTSGHGKGRRHASLGEYRQRLAVFKKNSAMITAHNASPNKNYTMAMNKFGDWTREEFLAVMLPKKYAKLSNNNRIGGGQSHENKKKKKLGKHELPYVPLTDISRIPTSVDWRGRGADSGVKDQANCGSCWAFGAVGALESAWFRATGESRRFSEQQVMDCSWGYVPGDEDAASACDGGEAWAGVGHIVDNVGGIADASNYQYLGQNDYCYESTRNGTAKFKGYARIPQYDDAALMEAVYSRGPITVSLDASQDSFTFYSSGVYYDTNCMWKSEDLDHSQMVVGYGSGPQGDYWIVKNSWSKLWGDNGYVKISRDNHGCGASTDAIYAVADVNNAT